MSNLATKINQTFIEINFKLNFSQIVDSENEDISEKDT